MIRTLGDLEWRSPESQSTWGKSMQEILELDLFLYFLKLKHKIQNFVMILKYQRAYVTKLFAALINSES
jgi:hypothetical protein